MIGEDSEAGASLRIPQPHRAVPRGAKDQLLLTSHTPVNTGHLQQNHIPVLYKGSKINGTLLHIKLIYPQYYHFTVDLEIFVS